MMKQHREEDALKGQAVKNQKVAFPPLFCFDASNPSFLMYYVAYNEVLAAEGIFHFEQVAPGLTPFIAVPSILFGSSECFLFVVLALFQEPIKTMFCNHDTEIEHTYDDLLNSSKQILDSMLGLQEVRFVAYAFTF
jgi:hypothetical protein